MAVTGKVKYWSDRKSYGWIAVDDDENAAGCSCLPRYKNRLKDVYIYVSEVQRAGLESLKPGQRVCFEPVVEARKPNHARATDIKVLT
jgi:cold shock CspA family protein